MIREFNSINVSNNSFSFDIQTSSGDKISLSLKDNKELDFSEQKGENWQKDSFSLKEELGYSFSYSGNGIDKNDKKEIERAMKLIKPIYQKFLENIKKSDKALDANHLLTNSAHDIKSKFPKLNSKDARILLKNKTIDTFDDIFSIFNKDKKLIENTKKLFDRLFDKDSKLELYA